MIRDTPWPRTLDEAEKSAAVMSAIWDAAVRPFNWDEFVDELRARISGLSQPPECIRLSPDMLRSLGEWVSKKTTYKMDPETPPRYRLLDIPIEIAPPYPQRWVGFVYPVSMDDELAWWNQR